MKKIIDYLEKNPGSKARTIANDLEMDRSEVNSLLYGKLSSRVFQDKKYNWFLTEVKLGNKRETQKKANTDLSKLSEYYLESTIQDSTHDIKVFAKSNFDDLDYAELDILPIGTDLNINEIIESNETAKKLLKKLKKSPSKKCMYIGYPNRLSKLHSKSGHDYFILEPVFYFPISSDDSGNLIASEENPNLNSSFIRNVTNARSSGTLEETLQLYDELGLDDTDDIPDLEDVFLRLPKIRPEWDWLEKIDPMKISKNKKLNEVEETGIYNKALLIFGDKSPYTQNLEKELEKLKYVTHDDYIQTSLGKLVHNQFNYSSKIETEEVLLEPLPINIEQRKAVSSALNSDITVITGPPGTGKSQVVTSILINAAWQEKKVLFASKNNKAVDVVEARVNGLSPSPILLRQGRNEIQKQLSEHLTNLLSIETTNEDIEVHENFKEKHNQLNEIRDTLQKKEEKLINLRNEFDTLDRRIETELKKRGITKQKFQYKYKKLLVRNSTDYYKKIIKRLRDCKASGGLGIKDWFSKEEREVNLGKILSVIDNEKLIKIPKKKSKDKITYNLWIDKIIEEIKKELEFFKLSDQIKDLPLKLKNLVSQGKPEDIAKEHKNLINELQDNSIELWKSYLKITPSRLSDTERKALNDYATVLDMITTSLSKDENVASNIWRKYYGLFPKVISSLPCWAITSLSAQRIPFEANYFDILVIDEASQCDIASAIPLMYRAKSIVIIGDPKQLKHISKIRKFHDHKLMMKYNLLDTHIGWSYSHTSLFDLCRGYCRPENLITLKDHHRSHSQIISFSNKHFYQENLRVATRHESLRTINDKKPAVRWVNVEGEAVRHPSGGSYNTKEIGKILSFLKDLIFNKEYKGSIGVTTPFREQANQIRNRISEDKELSKKILKRDFICDTVHKFQGDERDLMIFSPVISNNTPKSSLGFLSSNGNLFNVAITRARGALVVIGDFEKCLKSKVSYIEEFAKYTSELKYESDLDQDRSTNSLDLGPKYPNVAKAEKVSEWEKILYRELYKVGVKTVPQFNVDQFRLDLAYFKNGKKLNIEIDGEKYHKNWNGELCLRDRIRNLRLMELGWDVKRFWVYEIRDNLDDCVKEIKSWGKN